jgi:hypothetical protein
LTRFPANVGNLLTCWGVPTPRNATVEMLTKTVGCGFIIIFNGFAMGAKNGINVG